MTKRKHEFIVIP